MCDADHLIWHPQIVDDFNSNNYVKDEQSHSLSFMDFHKMVSKDEKCNNHNNLFSQ